MLLLDHQMMAKLCLQSKNSHSNAIVSGLLLKIHNICYLWPTTGPLVGQIEPAHIVLSPTFSVSPHAAFLLGQLSKIIWLLIDPMVMYVFEVRDPKSSFKFEKKVFFVLEIVEIVEWFFFILVFFFVFSVAQDSKLCDCQVSILLLS
jgi:hypothetical protein